VSTYGGSQKNVKDYKVQVAGMTYAGFDRERVSISNFLVMNFLTQYDLF
jgi:hypothetical protein